MEDRTQFGHLLAVLDDALNGRSPTRESAFADERTRAVVENLRGSPEAQVTLLLLAWEVKADAIDDGDRLREELRAFVATIRERFDVDLLRAAARTSGRLPTEFPHDLLPDPDTSSDVARP